jgi:excisionase family DNA binding protein
MKRRPGRAAPGRQRWRRRGGGAPAAWRGRWLGRPGTGAAGPAAGRDPRSTAGRGSSAGRGRSTARTPGSGSPRRWHPRARVDREGRWTNPTTCATMLPAITVASLGVIVTGGTELRLRTPTSRPRTCSSRSSGQPTGENTEGGNCAAAGGRFKPALASGHTTGTPLPQLGQITGSECRPPASQASAPPTIGPRLVSLQQAAEYLGVSYWTVRDLVDAGKVKRVRLPVGQRDVRRVLLDVRDLDRLVDLSKDIA